MTDRVNPWFEGALEQVQRDRPDKGMVYAVLALTEQMARIADALEAPPEVRARLRLEKEKESG